MGVATLPMTETHLPRLWWLEDSEVDEVDAWTRRQQVIYREGDDTVGVPSTAEMCLRRVH